MLFIYVLGAQITDDAILEHLLNGNLSTIEDIDDDGLDFEPNNLINWLVKVSLIVIILMKMKKLVTTLICCSLHLD